jgi:hypothetical protein
MIVKTRFHSTDYVGGAALERSKYVVEYPLQM